MKTKPITSVVVFVGLHKVTIVIKRGKHTSGVIQEGARVATILGILSNGTYTSQISAVEDVFEPGGPSHCRIQSITYRPMELSEHGYREVLNFVFRWITNNIDGYLEDNEQADKCWHLLGSIVEKGPYWTREQHKQEFLNITKFSEHWKSFWRNKG